MPGSAFARRGRRWSSCALHKRPHIEDGGPSLRGCSGWRKLPRRLPPQDLDAHHGQRREHDDHQDLPEVVDPGMNDSQSRNSAATTAVDRDRMVAQVRREEASHRDLVAPGPRQGAAADECDPDREDEQRPLAKPRGDDVPDRGDRRLDGLGGGDRFRPRCRSGAAAKGRTGSPPRFPLRRRSKPRAAIPWPDRGRPGRAGAPAPAARSRDCAAG